MAKGIDRWFQKHLDAVLRAWRNNEIGYGDAASRLMWLGYSVDGAYALLART